MPSADEAKIVRWKDGELRLENFYTPLAEAKKEIQKRWKDKALRKKIKDFLKGDIPDIFKKEPLACIGRHLATPDNEFRLFLEDAKKIKLNSVCIEYLADKFVAKSSDKYYLGKLVFSNGKGRNGGDKLNSLGIINFSDSEGTRLKEVRTLWGEKLVDFHHGLLNSIFKDHNHKNFDASKWFLKKGRMIDKFYIRYLSLFICHGILFEDYVTDKEEATFFKKIVLPNYKKIAKTFGLRPLIVRLAPSSDKKNDKFWWCYPESTKKFLNIFVVLGGKGGDNNFAKLLHHLHS